jgi:hypothetical protein
MYTLPLVPTVQLEEAILYSNDSFLYRKVELLNWKSGKRS